MSRAPEVNARTEIRDGMRVTWHQPIAMNDGLVLRADVYRPIDDGRYPVVLTYGIYAEGLEIVTSCIAVGGRVTLYAGGPREAYLLLQSSRPVQVAERARGKWGPVEAHLDSLTGGVRASAAYQPSPLTGAKPQGYARPTFPM
jgi:hypothetical protein